MLRTNCVWKHKFRKLLGENFYVVVGVENCDYIQFSFYGNRVISYLITNREQRPVERGQLSFLLKCCIRKRIQCCDCIFFCILSWYVPPWRVMLLKIANLSLFVLYLFVIKYCEAKVGVLIDKIRVCAPSRRCLYFHVMRLD